VAGLAILVLLCASLPYMSIVDRVLLRRVRQRCFAAGGQEKREGKSEKKRFFHGGPSY